MRKALIIALVILFISGAVYADGIDILLDNELERLDIQEIQSIADGISVGSSNIIPRLSIKEIIKAPFKKGLPFNINELLKDIWRYIMYELMLSFVLIGKIIILAVICSFFQNLHNGFQGESIGKLAYSICYIMIIMLALQSFSIVTSTCISTIDTIVSFMQALMPILITLLFSLGGIASSTLFQPIVYTSLTAVVTFIKTIVIPMVIFSSVLSIISNISDKVRISRLASLIRGVAIALLGIILTAFTGIASIQGLAASSFDGVVAKTAKFTVDSFIPVIGDFLSEAFDVVMGCSLLLKNGISITGLILLIFIILLPVIKILAIFLSYKLGAALIQPIIDNELVQSLNDISNSVFALFCCMASVGILFFIAITVIMGIGNATVMMR